MSEREMEELIAKLERQLGMAWRDIVDWIRDQNPVDAIEKRLRERGMAGGLIRELEAAASRFADDAHAAYVDAGRKAMTWLDDQVPDSLIRFNETNTRAMMRAQQSRYELIRGIDEEQRAVVRNVITEGMRTGTNPREMARDIRDSLGLTESQTGHVLSYRRALETGDWRNAVGRELRDRRFDRTLRKLRNERGEMRLPAEQVDRMVERYRKNYVAFRAETVARTEALRAAHEGHDEAMQQAIERGDVLASELESTWHAGPRTKHARDQHQAMDDRRVPYGADFVLPDGTRMRGPGDPRGGAKHNASCRCAKSTTYTAESAEPSTDAPTAKPASEVRPTETAKKKKKNPKRVEAARKAAEASVERRREIHSAVRSNIAPELQTAWDQEGYKFMREEAGRIKGIKDRINASSKLSEAFAEKYGSGQETAFGNEGDRYFKRAEIEARHAETWADEQERRYYEAAQRDAMRDGEIDERGELTEVGRARQVSNDEWASSSSNADDDEPPF